MKNFKNIQIMAKAELYDFFAKTYEFSGCVTKGQFLEELLCTLITNKDIVDKSTEKNNQLEVELKELKKKYNKLEAEKIKPIDEILGMYVFSPHSEKVLIGIVVDFYFRNICKQNSINISQIEIKAKCPTLFALFEKQREEKETVGIATTNFTCKLIKENGENSQYSVEKTLKKYNYANN